MKGNTCKENDDGIWLHIPTTTRCRATVQEPDCSSGRSVSPEHDGHKSRRTAFIVHEEATRHLYNDQNVTAGDNYCGPTVGR
ncbi:MAG: hypothetical protein OD815_001916 [Candidatus Alkanophagales archaeon MCA70_species_2]|nr:hypothetical protein [Candidatus Alkanophaga liquidiphilum]